MPERESSEKVNEYLLNHPTIVSISGTAAAEGVSASDMTRRKVLEKQKKNMMKKLNMFVSPLGILENMY